MSGAKRRAFQDKLIDDLKRKSFKRLIQLPESTEIPAPTAVNDWKFTVNRRQVEAEVWEFEVEARKDLSKDESMSFVKAFRISSDGRIWEEQVDVDD